MREKDIERDKVSGMMEGFDCSDGRTEMFMLGNNLESTLDHLEQKMSQQRKSLLENLNLSLQFL
jgi:hypothetical protein